MGSEMFEEKWFGPLPSTKPGEDVDLIVRAAPNGRLALVDVQGVTGAYDDGHPDNWRRSFSIPRAELEALHAFIGEVLAATPSPPQAPAA